MGIISGVLGILWISVYHLFLYNLNTEFPSFLGFLSLLDPVLILIFSPVIYPAALELALLLLTFLLAILLVVTGVMIGIGFYSISIRGGGPIGVAALITSITGTTITGILLILSEILWKELYLPWYLYYYYYPVVLSIYIPNPLLIWYSSITLGITLVVLGLACVLVHEYIQSSNSAMAAGILGIIVGLLFIQLGYTFILPNFSPTLPSYLHLGIPSFGLLMVCMVLWIYMFYSSKEV